MFLPLITDTWGPPADSCPDSIAIHLSRPSHTVACLAAYLLLVVSGEYGPELRCRLRGAGAGMAELGPLRGGVRIPEIKLQATSHSWPDLTVVLTDVGTICKSPQRTNRKDKLALSVLGVLIVIILHCPTSQGNSRCSWSAHYVAGIISALCVLFQLTLTTTYEVGNIIKSIL